LMVFHNQFVIGLVKRKLFLSKLFIKLALDKS
jgi:hypothetical protein